MAAPGIAGTWERGADRRFFTVMAGVVALLVAAGFGPTYVANLPPPGLPFWVHLHGATMVAWIALFAVQAWLVNRRALPLHRRLGWASIGLVAVMLPLGLATNMLAIQRGATPPFFTPARMMASDFLDIFLFGGLFAAAVLLRRNGPWHKRLMLSATLLLAWPALGRLAPRFGADLAMILPISSVLLVLLALIGPAFDLATRRRVHPAYFWAVGLIALAQPLHEVLAATPLVQGFAARLGG